MISSASDQDQPGLLRGVAQFPCEAAPQAIWAGWEPASDEGVGDTPDRSLAAIYGDMDALSMDESQPRGPVLAFIGPGHTSGAEPGRRAAQAAQG